MRRVAATPKEVKLYSKVLRLGASGVETASLGQVMHLLKAFINSAAIACRRFNVSEAVVSCEPRGFLTRYAPFDLPISLVCH